MGNKQTALIQIEAQWKVIEHVKEEGLESVRLKLGEEFLKLRDLYAHAGSKHEGVFEKEIEKRGYKPRTVRKWIRDFQHPGTNAAYERERRTSGPRGPQVSKSNGHANSAANTTSADGTITYAINVVLKQEREKSLREALESLGDEASKLIYDFVIMTAAKRRPKNETHRAPVSMLIRYGTRCEWSHAGF